MNKKLAIILSLSLLLANISFALTPEQIIERVKDKYLQVKDLNADIVLNYHVKLLGCGGTISWPGKFHYKAPDKMKFEFTDRDTYWIKGNRIRKMDNKGKKFYVQLINAADMSVGLNPGMIPHNFNLTLLKETNDEYVIEGIPKPGILKNAKKLIFHIEKKRDLLTAFDVIFPNPKLNGTLTIDYQQINGLWTPIGMHGLTAMELSHGILVGLGIDLQTSQVKTNTGLPSSLFDPGF